jgi:hypothetical protein
MTKGEETPLVSCTFHYFIFKLERTVAKQILTKEQHAMMMMMLLMNQ